MTEAFHAPPSLFEHRRGLTSCCGDRQWPAGACFDQQRKYRYALWLKWADRPTVVFVLLNPSYADGHTLDNTARACRDFAINLGFGGMEMVNAFPIIGTKPAQALAHPLRDGEDDGKVNLRHVRAALQRANRVILGFGTHLAQKRQESALHRIRRVFSELDLLEPLPVPGAAALDHRPYALELTASGMPKQPLYIRRDTPPFAFVFPDKSRRLGSNN